MRVGGMTDENKFDKARALNEDLKARRPDLKWIVEFGKLVLIDDPEWSQKHARKMAVLQEEQRQTFLKKQALRETEGLNFDWDENGGFE